MTRSFINVSNFIKYLWISEIFFHIRNIIFARPQMVVDHKWSSWQGMCQSIFYYHCEYRSAFHSQLIVPRVMRFSKRFDRVLIRVIKRTRLFSSWQSIRKFVAYRWQTPLKKHWCTYLSITREQYGSANKVDNFSLD